VIRERRAADALGLVCALGMRRWVIAIVGCLGSGGSKREVGITNVLCTC
jgi:hypothetical protein